MRLRDEMPTMHGKLQFDVYRKGEWESRYLAPNLIVDSGRKKLANIMAGLDTGKISQIGVGTGTTAAAVTDTGLTDQLLIDVSTASVDSLTARFDFEIDESTANGLNIKEFGLFFDDGTMFSHRVRDSDADLVKSSDITIKGYWEVDF